MEEDINIIKKHYVFTTNHVLDDENKRFKQAIENLINKYKEQKRDIQASHILLAKYSQKNEEQEKVIDFMIEWIRARSIYVVDSHEKLKDYFKKKSNENNEH